MYSFTSNSSTVIGIASIPLNITENSIGLLVQTISSKLPTPCIQHISYMNDPLPRTPQTVQRNLPFLTPIHLNQSIHHQEHNWWKNSHKHLFFKTLPSPLKGITKEKARKDIFH